jgi:hypothetical protein
MLRKKGIKGNATDRPITEHPRFGHIQWNQSCFHMPRVAPEPEPEMMDMDKLVALEPATPELVELPVEAEEEDQQEEEEYEESITLRASDFAALQDTLEDIRFQILDIQRDAR